MAGDAFAAFRDLERRAAAGRRPRRRGDARRAERRRRRHPGRVFERQLQGRAGGDGHRQDHPAVPAHRRHRRRRHGRVEQRRAVRAGDRVLVTGYDLGVAHDGGYAELRPRAGRLGRAAPGRPDAARGDGARHRRLHGRPGGAAARTERPAPGRARSPSPAPPAASAASPSPRWRGLATRSPRSPARTTSTTICERSARREVLSRHDARIGTRPLEKATWAGAVDAVGGDLLAWLTRTTNHWGGVASTGLTGGIDLQHHGDAVHPARRQPARHRLGDVPDGHPPSRSGAGWPPT